ncbi:MAG TPA: hypothetical protein PKL99_00195 [Syntrophales bacterium]|nr:hypothetical protein [Syntrophales bacterium]
MCHREFDEEAIRDYSPAEELVDILLPSLGIESVDDICPDCREELGILGLLGLGQ